MPSVADIGIDGQVKRYHRNRQSRATDCACDLLLPELIARWSSVDCHASGAFVDRLTVSARIAVAKSGIWHI
jgi:hypothetical protein